MSNALNKKQIEFLNRHTKGTWSYNPATGLVDVEGDFRFSNCIYEKPEDLKGVRFGKVRGSFDCSYNYLTSLAGAPQKVGGISFVRETNLQALQEDHKRLVGISIVLVVIPIKTTSQA